MFIRFGRKPTLNFIIATAMASAAGSGAATAASTKPLVDGQIYVLQTKTEAPNRWLSSNPASGTVNLQPNTNTGSLWRARATADGTYTFEAVSNVVGPRWLAVDANKKVVLQRSDSALSARWKVSMSSEGHFSLASAALDGADKMLDAKVESSSLGLSPQADGVYTGANWKLYAQSTVRTAVDHGDLISLKSMSRMDGPRFLEGAVFDNKLSLQWTDEAKQYSGAVWRMHDNGDGTFSMECLGNWPANRWLSVKNNTLTFAETSDRGLATRWQITRDEGAGVTIRNADTSGNPYLTSSPATGSVSLASGTGGGNSGTHWQIFKQKAFNPSVEGKWSSVESLPTAPIHAIQLLNGKVLYWSRFVDASDAAGSADGVAKGSSNTYLFDPVTGSSKAIGNAPVDPYGSSHTFLADGRVFVAGGFIKPFMGQKAAQIFDPATNQWSRTSDMSWGRWNSSSITLSNGDIFTMTGTNMNEGDLTYTPEVWLATTGKWRKLVELRDCGGGSCTLMSPWIHLAPNGKVFVSGANQATGYIDPNNGTWTSIGDSNSGFRGVAMGTAVGYEPGKVLLAGGSPPTASAEMIDLTGSGQWTNTPNMIAPRREPSGTILADGSVFITGGSERAAAGDATAVFTAETWTPATRAFAPADHSRVPRLFQATTTLLPDGRVLNMGGGLAAGLPTHKNYQIFSPAYLFKGERPVVTGAPSQIAYNTAFKVSSANAEKIGKVHLIRLSSQTRSFNYGQTLVPLNFTKAGTELTITGPANGNIAAPGPYMLFVVDQSGVPSHAAMLLLK